MGYALKFNSLLNRFTSSSSCLLLSSSSKFSTICISLSFSIIFCLNKSRDLLLWIV